MTNKRSLLLKTTLLTTLLMVSGNCFAADTTAGATKAESQTDMAAANQAMNNPITDFTLLIVENDIASNNGSITTKDRYQNITLIEPLLPISIGDTGWNLINRPVVPIVSASTPSVGLTGVDWDTKSGLGDIVFSVYLNRPPAAIFSGESALH